MGWISDDMQHEGAPRVVDLLGIVQDFPIWEIPAGRDPEKLQVRAVCGCGWHENETGTVDCIPFVLFADGTVNVEATETAVRRLWQDHVDMLALASAALSAAEMLAGPPMAKLKTMEPLERLRTVRHVRLGLDVIEREAVIEARRTPGQESWAKIGVALGTTKQAVYERFREAERKAIAEGPRCQAANAEDPTPCEGDREAVRVVDKLGGEALGCVHHAARLYATLEDPRVYPNGDANNGKALEVYHRAADLKPWPWDYEKNGADS